METQDNATLVFENSVTLDGLERKLREHYPKTTTRGQTAKVNLVRFADDFIITGSSRELLENQVQPLVEQFMQERGLELSPEKTRITHIEDGFDFLGQNTREYTGKILIKPSRKNVAAFLGKVRRTIQANAQATAGHLTVQLNPMIRGWANYHQHVSSKQTFGKVDHAIFQALWQWAKRRHSKKSKRWIKNKYFHTVGRRHWVFRGETTGKDGRPETVRLFYAANGICPVCGEKITKLTGWHNHHIVWRTKGGGDSVENRVLLHPNCHSQVHSRGLAVAKPRSAKSV